MDLRSRPCFNRSRAFLIFTMRHMILLLSGIVFLSPMFAQDGFNKKFGNQAPTALFYNLLLDDDTVVVFGVGVDSLQYLVFGRLDTLGNWKSSKKIYDNLGRSFYANLNYDIIISMDGNYWAIGEIGGGQSGFLIQVASNFDLISFKEYFDPSVLATFQRKIIKINNSYIISGHKATSNYSSDVYFIKTDTIGNKIFEKRFSEVGSLNLQTHIFKKSENEIIISGSHSNVQGTPLPQWWAQSWIFAIDSMGNKLWEFEGPVNEEISAIGIQPTPNGGWIYGSGTFELLPNNDWGSTTKVVCRDSVMNLLWETPISPTVYSTNRIRDVVPSPDGTYIVVGEWTTQKVQGIANYGGGSIVKINMNGEIIWSHLFTGYPNQPNGTANYLGGAVVLPSGSIVATGYSRRFHPSFVASQGWIIKISPDGCVVDTLCTTSSATEWPSKQLGVNVYPNPAHDYVVFETGDDAGEGFDVVVFDVLGNLVWQYNGKRSEKQVVWDASFLKSGIYFYHVGGRSFHKSGKLVVE
jgi:Secretion system C-terminal sorting domain